MGWRFFYFYCLFLLKHSQILISSSEYRKAWSQFVNSIMGKIRQLLPSQTREVKILRVGAISEQMASGANEHKILKEER